MELKANTWYVVEFSVQVPADVTIGNAADETEFAKKVGAVFGEQTFIDSLTIRTEPAWVKRDD